MPRAGRIALSIITWPWRALARLTSDGGLFLGLALICGLLSIGANTWSNIPLLMALVMASMWLITMWQGTRSLRKIHFRRSHVERVFANDTVNVSLHLSNTSRLPSAGLVITERLEPEREPLPVRAGGAGAANTGAQEPMRTVVAQGTSFVTVVSGRAQERARYSVSLRRRGIYRFGDTIIETVFPLGFFNSASVRHASGRLVVYPRLGEVDTSFFEELELALRYVRCSRPSRAEEDFRGLREYRDGDNPRWIHWRSTARTQKLLVKEFEEPQAKRLLLLIDTNLQRLGTQRFAAFELAIAFSGTIVRDLARRGYEVECVALQPQGRLARVCVSRDRRNMDQLLEMLAGLRRNDNQTLADLLGVLGRRSLHHVYVLALGLGSLRVRASLNWLKTTDNVVRVFDGRGEEFRRVFRPAGLGSAREEFTEEDMLMEIGAEEGDEQTEAEVRSAKVEARGAS